MCCRVPARCTCPSFRVDDLFTLSRPPISLISLACAVDLSPSVRLFLGASLQSLTLTLNGKANTAAINDAILTISRLALLEKLILSLPSLFPEMSFAPLAVAPQLKALHCGVQYIHGEDLQPTDDQLDQLRMMPHMRTMDVHGLSGDSSTCCALPTHCSGKRFTWSSIPMTKWPLRCRIFPLSPG